MKFPHTAFIVLLLTTLTASAADEADNRSPLDRYRGDSQYHLLMCSMSFKMAALKADGGQPQDEKDDYAGCIKKGKAESKANLDKALRTLKKPQAREALKTYHVAFVSALEGIFPGADERRISYE